MNGPVSGLHVAVIGGGISGIRAALTLARAGCQVTLYEKNQHLGGRVFSFVTPEYNYGPSAVLKNAIDWVYPEWNRKAVAFVSYGSAMGVRSVQQLRQTMTELQLAPIRSSVQGET